MRRWRWAAGLLLTLASLLTACSPPQPRSPAADELRRSASVLSALGRAASIGLALPSAEREPWTSLAHGAREEAVQYGIELIVMAAGSDDAERQARQVAELADRPVDLLLVGDGDDPSVLAAVDSARRRGVPVAGLSSLVPVDRLVFRVAADDYAMGKSLGDCLGRALGGRGNIALVGRGVDSVPALEQALGLKHTLRDQYRSMTLVAHQAAPPQHVAVAAQVVAWLERWPDLAGLVATDEVSALGALEGLSTAGRLGEVKVAASGLGAWADAALQEGTLECAVFQQAVAEGRAAVRNAVAYLAGHPFERNIKGPPLPVTRGGLPRVDWGLVFGP